MEAPWLRRQFGRLNFEARYLTIYEESRDEPYRSESVVGPSFQQDRPHHQRIKDEGLTVVLVALGPAAGVGSRRELPFSLFLCFLDLVLLCVVIW